MVKPSLKDVPVGTRVCSFWSKSFTCLHIGTVLDLSPRNKDGADSDTSDDEEVFIDFDDGDSKWLPLDLVRMLPPDFPVQGL